MGTDDGVIRRLVPGSKFKDFYKWPDEQLEDMESTLAVQQFIHQKIRSDYTDLEAILDLPQGVDVNVWNYEHLRQFCYQLNELCVLLQPVCTAETCSQMTATDSWIFLCAVHKTPKECCAIEYIRHTLDGAANLLNSNRYFPSRVNLKESSVSKLPSTCRRVYRIFSHAFFHHKPIYDDFEKNTLLCHRFDRFVNKFDLMGQDLLIVPLDESDGYAKLKNNSVIEPNKESEEEATEVLEEDEGHYESVLPRKEEEGQEEEEEEENEITVREVPGEVQSDIIDVADVDDDDDDDDDDEDATIRE